MTDITLNAPAFWNSALIYAATDLHLLSENIMQKVLEVFLKYIVLHIR